MRKTHTLAFIIIFVFLGGISTGCKGTSKEKLWAWRWGWDERIPSEVGEPLDDGYDENGDYVPPPEVKATYQWPDVHAGFLYDVTQGKIRPALDIELAEFRVPFLRWQGINIGAAQDFGYVSINHIWTSIYEVETGLYWGYDLAEEEHTWGFSVTLTKF